LRKIDKDWIAKIGWDQSGDLQTDLGAVNKIIFGNL
jgi:hypothetical protein